MPVTGLYFLPTAPAEVSPLPCLVDRIMAEYACTALPQWSLDHRLFRGRFNPPQASMARDGKPPADSSFLQMLALSYDPGRSHIAATTIRAASQTRATGTPSRSDLNAEGSGEPTALVSIPSGQQSDNFLHLAGYEMGGRWLQRPALTVTNGLTYGFGEYRVRLGEVCQRTGTGIQLRGIVVLVEWAGLEADGGEEWDLAEQVIRAFWNTLGLMKGKGVVQVAGAEKGDAIVRQWFEILRFKS